MVSVTFRSAWRSRYATRSSRASPSRAKESDALFAANLQHYVCAHPDANPARDVLCERPRGTIEATEGTVLGFRTNRGLTWGMLRHCSLRLSSRSAAGPTSHLPRSSQLHAWLFKMTDSEKQGGHFAQLSAVCADRNRPVWLRDFTHGTMVAVLYNSRRGISRIARAWRGCRSVRAFAHPQTKPSFIIFNSVEY